MQGGGEGALVITLTDRVYVSEGAVETGRLDKVSDWPKEIYGKRVTVNVHLMFLWTVCAFVFEGL